MCRAVVLLVMVRLLMLVLLVLLMLLLLLAMLVPVLEITAPTIEVSTTSTTRSVGRNSATDSYTESVSSSCKVKNMPTFRRDTGPDFDIRLFQYHATLQWSTASAAVLSCQRPFAVSIRKP